MKKPQWFWVIVLCVLLVIPLLLALFHHPSASQSANPPQTSQSSGSNQGTPQKGKNPAPKPAPNPAPKQQTLWGVDTASQVDNAFYKCVMDNYGKPDVVGRYLESKSGTSTGLTSAEVTYLHKQGIKVLPIFNHFTSATSYNSGVAEAKEAIAYAKKIGVPKGVAIFADIEPGYSVDDAFIRGWADTLVASQYKPGIYGVFAKGNPVISAYQTAAGKNKNVQNNVIIWSSNPVPGITKKAAAPKFQPNAPNNVKVSVWQYGMDGKTCNVDTDLVQINGVQFLW